MHIETITITIIKNYEITTIEIGQNIHDIMEVPHHALGPTPSTLNARQLGFYRMSKYMYIYRYLSHLLFVYI